MLQQPSTVQKNVVFVLEHNLQGCSRLFSLFYFGQQHMTVSRYLSDRHHVSLKEVRSLFKLQPLS